MRVKKIQQGAGSCSTRKWWHNHVAYHKKETIEPRCKKTEDEKICSLHITSIHCTRIRARHPASEVRAPVRDSVRERASPAAERSVQSRVTCGAHAVVVRDAAVSHLARFWPNPPDTVTRPPLRPLLQQTRRTAGQFTTRRTWQSPST